MKEAIITNKNTSLRVSDTLSFQQYRVFRFVVAATLLVTAFSIAFPVWMQSVEPYLVLVLVLILGVPHGATDLTIFKAFAKRVSWKGLIIFSIAYLGVIGLYAAMWWALPVQAFGLFLIMSVYHFGQSNLAPIVYDNRPTAVLHYLIWGATALFVPVLLHAEHAQAIVVAMTSYSFPLPEPSQLLFIIWSIVGLNVLSFVLLLIFGKISVTVFVRELIHLVVLLQMFFYTSLLLGFTIYFVFWHSLASVIDQNNFFQRKIQSYRWQHFLWLALPVALTGCLLVVFIRYYLPEGLVLSHEIMGYIFIGLSLLTLPHMLLVDQLYKQKH